MDKTLYLHIGTPKTGTTSLQHFFYDNKNILSEKGYYYPNFNFKYPNRGITRKNGLFLEAPYFDAEGVRHKEIETENFYSGLAKLREFFNTHNNIIISNESIWTACFNRKRGLPLLRKLQEEAQDAGYQIKIIAYLRRQDDFLLSWYNQLVKHSFSTKNTLSWEEYYNNRETHLNLDYYNCLKKLEKIFGKENIIVKRFDRKYLKDQSIIPDFLSIFGIELDNSFNIEEDTPVFNTKMSENACEIKRIINGTTEMKPEEIRKFEWILRGFSPVSENDYPCSMMSEEEAVNIMQQYEDSNSKIVKRYIKDGKPLFNMEKTYKEKWEKNNEYMINDVIRFSCMSTLCTMQMIEERDAQIKEMQKILDHPFRFMLKKFLQFAKTS